MQKLFQKTVVGTGLIAGLFASSLAFAMPLTNDPDVGILNVSSTYTAFGGPGNGNLAGTGDAAMVTTMGDVFDPITGTFSFNATLASFDVNPAASATNRFSIDISAATCQGVCTQPEPTGMVEGEILALIISGSGAATTYTFDVAIDGGSGELRNGVFGGITDAVIVYNLGIAMIGDGPLAALDTSFMAFAGSVDLTTVAQVPVPGSLALLMLGGLLFGRRALAA